MKSVARLFLLALLLCNSMAYAETDPVLADTKTRSVRTTRPFSLSGGALGKTPIYGFQIDMNPHPYAGIGVGYGLFSLGNISAKFIPVFAQGYIIDSNFSPYVTAGINFVTLKFAGGNALFNSTFRGAQVMIGAGLEYRFDFGLLLRLDGLYYINAKVWAPGVSVGYSFEIQ